MTENKHLGSNISYNPFSTQDKHYFGGFFNLAHKNINEVFEELKTRFPNLGKREPEDILNFIFKENISIVDYERWVIVFSEYFPIAEILDKKHTDNGEETSTTERVIYFRENFINLLNAIEKLRHYYTHYYHEPITIDDDTLNFLNKALFKTALNVKKNYLKTDKTKELLSKSLQAELDNLLEKKRQELNKNTADIINLIYDDAFKNYLYYNKKEKILELANFSSVFSSIGHSFYKNPDFNLGISQSGIVFLLSLFLDRKEVEALKANITGFKGKIVGENSLMFMATHRIYSILAYKGLRRRIQASQEANKESLLMQMLDEMSKVPDIVYKNLSEENQKSFIEDWNEYFKDYEEYDGGSEDAKVVHPVVRKRYEDKFNYFALRFLDEYANFPSLRFQVYLGDYIHHQTEKRIGDSSIITNRVIKDKISVFARLNEVNEAKINFLANTEPQETAWQEFPNPSYLFPKEPDIGRKRQLNSGKIGIQVKLLNKDLKKEIDNAQSTLNPNQRKDDKRNKDEIIQQIIFLNENTENSKPIVYSGQPIAYLSMNDIHSILFEFFHLVEDGKTEKEAGEIIERKVVEQIQNQISEIRDKNTDTKILKKYKSTEDGTTVNLKKLITDLEKEQVFLQGLIEQHEKRKEDFEKSQKDRKYKPQRKHLLFYNEKGKLAVWIANDLKRFFPQNFKNNWKGYQHSELQRALAYYEFDKSNLLTLLNDLDMNHIPFDFKKCLNKKTLADFYELYLKERIDFIDTLRMQINDFQDEPKVLKKVIKCCFLFLKPQNYKINDLDTQIQRILAHPIFIERGFMDEKPTFIQGITYNEKTKDQFANWFISYRENDSYQKFYDEALYPIQEEEKREKGKIYKKINQQKRNDFYALKMAQWAYTDIFGKDADFKLNDLFKTKAERDESGQKAKDLGVAKENFIWDRSIRLELFNGRAVTESVKLKDVGKYRKYEIDKRIKTFMEYEPRIKDWLIYLPNKRETEEITNHIIQKEIDQYEKIRREELLKEVQEVEKYIYEKIGDDDSLKRKGNPNFKYYVLNGLLKTVKEIDIEEFKVLTIDTEPEKADLSQLTDENEFCAFALVYIRNKFAHNEMPKKEFFDLCLDTIPLEYNEMYSDYFVRVFQEARKQLGIEKTDE